MPTLEPLHVLIGVLIEVYPGQALKVQPFTASEPVDIFVMDPEPYRGKEGYALIMDFDRGLVPIRIMGSHESPSFLSSYLESEGHRRQSAAADGGLSDGG